MVSPRAAAAIRSGASGRSGGIHEASHHHPAAGRVRRARAPGHRPPARPTRCGSVAPASPRTRAPRAARATRVAADGTMTPDPAPKPGKQPIDCFYVYPTVSLQPTPNATLDIEPNETGVALAQASRYSLGVQGLRADVPAAHDRRDRRERHRRGGRDRVRRRPGRVARLPRARQPRSRCGADRAFAGRGHAHPTRPARDRQEAEGPQAARRGLPARRERGGAEGTRRRRRLRACTGVPEADADRVRRRVLHLQRDAAGGRDLRTASTAGSTGSGARPRPSPRSSA